MDQMTPSGRELRVRVRVRTIFRVRVRVRAQVSVRVRVRAQVRGGILLTTSHSNFYSLVGQIAIFSHCEP